MGYLLMQLLKFSDFIFHLFGIIVGAVGGGAGITTIEALHVSA